MLILWSRETTKEIQMKRRDFVVYYDGASMGTYAATTPEEAIAHFRRAFQAGKFTPVAVPYDSPTALHTTAQKMSEKRAP